MSSPTLNPVSGVVLGLLARDGPSTAYELKAAVAGGIAVFWPFPHSQIYSEAERLARAGLLAARREESGRRRRTYRITRSGAAALSAWLADPAADELQYRSLALLKLFFAHFAAPADVAALARRQRALIDGTFARYGPVPARLRARGDRPGQLAVAELLLAAQRTMARQWARIEGQAQEIANPAPPGKGRPRRGAR